MARKTKLTPDTQKRIVGALRVGSTHRLTCQYAGIHVDTFYHWLKLGEQGRVPYAAFSEAVKKAEGTAGVKWLAQINAAARAGCWQSAAWLLERRWPQEYGRQVREHTGPDGAPMTIKVVYEEGMSGLLQQAKDMTEREDHE